MPVRSAFDGLRVPRELVCEFFATFSRFEFLLKETGFARPDQNDRVAPDWDRFAIETAAWLKVEDESDVAAAVAYLNDEPPQVQVGPQEWKKATLAGKASVERALHATRRVRNNLFHGGKHTPHSPPGRDEKLVRLSLALLYACLEQNENLRVVYEEMEV